MPVPTYDRFIEPLLRYLAERPEGASIAEAYEVLAQQLGLTSDDKAELLPSGAQAVYKNRFGWAHDRLMRAGYSESPRRGWWQLTPEGMTFASKRRKLSDDDIDKLASVDRGVRLRPRSDAERDDSSPEQGGDTSSADQSPEERIGAAIAELRASVSRDLLENIGRAPQNSSSISS